jgi:hypothetical protein
MKTSLLAIALAVATMPLTFAQATPATGSSSPQTATATVKTKKHVKKIKKTSKNHAGATAVTPSR